MSSSPGAPAGAALPPADRYGRAGSPTRARRMLVVAFAVFTAAVVAFAAWVALEQSERPVTWGGAAYSIPSNAEARITFMVTLAPGTRAVCTVRARNVEFAEVGRLDVPVGPFADRTEQVTAVIPTSEQAVNADVRSCAAA